MDRYTQNAKWLQWFAPFRNLSISAAYLIPFFIGHGMSQTEIFLLQSIFSLTYLLWEIPSGIIADRWGRAFSIKLSAPLAALAMIAYGFSGQFWQFVVCEIALAIANGLISGVDTALLYDSLKADGRQDEYVRRSQRIQTFGFGAAAAGVPVAILLVSRIGISATLVADGLLTLLGCYFAWRLVEAPRYNGGQEALRLSAWPAMRQLARNAEVRWLVCLGSALSTATYLGFWLTAPYLTSIGVPVALFSAILATRSLWKAWLSYRFPQEQHVRRNMAVYAALSGLVYLAMASGQLWLLWAVLGHDIVQALHRSPLSERLNVHMDPEYRATMNSVANLVQRLVFTIAGPLVGLSVDRYGLQTGLVITGVSCSSAAFLALWRLDRLRTFAERR